MKQRIQISEHFTMGKMLRFALPSIGMYIVDNTYQIADGYFISNYIGVNAFAAENLIFPPMVIVLYIGMMFGTGGSALIARELGAGRTERANRLMGMVISVLATAGTLLAAAFFILVPEICGWVGVAEEIRPACIAYARVLACFMPFQMLSMAFHPLLVTAGQPGLGLKTTIANAAANILLDWLFVGVLKWGIVTNAGEAARLLSGAALATGLAWTVSAVIPLIYFLNPKNPLHLARPCMDGKALGKTMYNGTSEMVTGISYAFVSMVFNMQLLRYLHEAGVSASAVSEYVSGMFLAILSGISMSIVPVVGYQLGRKDIGELRGLRKTGLTLMGITGVTMTVLAFALADPIARIFVGYDAEVTALAIQALRIICFSYMLSGLTTFSSSYFTGLNQGTASLVIAACKGLIGPLAGVLLLPRLIGATGLWFTTPAAEVLALAAALVFYAWWRKKEESGNLPEPKKETGE